MRIIFYCLNFSPELIGVGKYTGELVNWLASNGHKIEVITTKPYYPQWVSSKNIWFYKKETVITNNNFKFTVWRCPIYVPKKPTLLKRILHLLSFSIFSLPILITKLLWRPDFVWTVQPTIFCSPATLLYSFFTKSKSILHIQDFEIDAAFSLKKFNLNNRIYKYTQYIEKFLYNQFDIITIISMKMRDKLIQKKIYPKKIYYFPNWTDLNMVFPITNNETDIYSKLLDIEVGSRIVMYSGSIGEKQGIELIFNVARYLAAHKNIYFVICGNGSSIDTLKSLSSNIKNIRWLPLQPDNLFNMLLNYADIHLIPQMQAVSDLMLPSKIKNIFASGVPAIVSTLPHTELFNLVNSRGIVVPPNDVNSLADSILLLLSNPSLAMSLGTKAREYAINNFDKNVIIADFEKNILES
jgi:colanic acid biosynthesis glycosyl transferase WcaI